MTATYINFQPDEPRYFILIKNIAKDRYLIRDRETGDSLWCRKAGEGDVADLEVQGIVLTRTENK